MKKMVLNLAALAVIVAGAADLFATESVRVPSGESGECCGGDGVYCCGFSVCILNPDGSVGCA